MKKISYESGETSEVTTPSPAKKETGARGFTIGGAVSPEYYDNSGGEEEKDVQDMTSYSEDNLSELMSKLVDISDALDGDGEEKSANFIDFLIKKFATVEKVNGTDLFNKLIINIRRADLPDTNEMIKKLTKIYSRSILLEYMKSNDLDQAKESAYKKVLHRADQYLQEG